MRGPSPTQLPRRALLSTPNVQLHNGSPQRRYRAAYIDLCTWRTASARDPLTMLEAARRLTQKCHKAAMPPARPSTCARGTTKLKKLGTRVRGQLHERPSVGAPEKRNRSSKVGGLHGAGSRGSKSRLACQLGDFAGPVIPSLLFCFSRMATYFCEPKTKRRTSSGSAPPRRPARASGATERKEVGRHPLRDASPGHRRAHH